MRERLIVFSEETLSSNEEHIFYRHSVHTATERNLKENPFIHSKKKLCRLQTVGRLQRNCNERTPNCSRSAERGKKRTWN